MLKRKHGIWGLVGLLMTPAVCQSATLTFDDATCAGGLACNANGLAIDQSYGDIAGQLDVKWDGNIGTTTVEDFRFWTTGYTGLTDVGYGISGATTEIFFDPLPGYQVTLTSFQISDYSQGVTTQIELFEGANTSSFYSTGPFNIANGTGPLTFDQSVFGTVTSTDGIRLQFGPDAFYAAIDNIEFSVTAVPLPAAAWLFASALGVLGYAGWRKKAA